MICETRILLNDEDTLRMLDKAYKRKAKVVMKKKDTKKDITLDRWWVVLTHPDAVDDNGNFIPQGYCEISIEILPKEASKELENGMGRDTPNQHPILPEPTGRMKFDLFSPFSMLKELLGPELACKLCLILYCSVFCVLFIYWLFMFGGSFASAIAASWVS